MRTGASVCRSVWSLSCNWSVLARRIGGVAVNIQSVTWKGLRCTVVVDCASAGLRVDIRTKAALESSSLAASAKPLEGGKASLAVVDDEQIGTVAVVVVLSVDGNVVQQCSTTVGEQ